MFLHVTVISCFVFVGCGASSQNRLARRIASLERALEGLRADFLADQVKQQQHISECDRTVKDEQDRRRIIENQIAELRLMFDKHLKDVQTPRPTHRPTAKPRPPVTPKATTGVPRPRPSRKPTPKPRPTPPVTPRRTRPVTRRPTPPVTPTPVTGVVLPVRLVGGNSSDEGRVELRHDNTWGTVCVNSWDFRDATVVCRQLGDSNSIGIPIVDGRFGQGSGPIWMDQTACKGNEAGLGTCPAMKWMNNDCNHSEDTGVRCLDVPVLRFTKAYGLNQIYIAIEAGGAAVRDKAFFTAVRTDGLLNAGRRYYWEVELRWRVRSLPSYSNWDRVGGVGVRREGSLFSQSLGFDDRSWAVRIEFTITGLNQWRYECRHRGKSVFISRHVIYNNSDVTNHLGFLLDTVNKMLTVIEVKNNVRLCSFPAVDGRSRPLVPVARFGSSFYQKRFRLPAVHPSRLPETVTDLLQN